MKVKSSKVKRFRLLRIMLVLAACTVGLRGNESAASGAYLIKINKQQNCVTIYEKNSAGKYKAIKAMICSTGTATKTGSYSLGEKLRWHTLDGPSYGQYCCRIYGAVLFHSVWYYTDGDPSTISCTEYNKLGTTASHGCVRLNVADAKWIYDNMPAGTPIQIYNSKNPGPLGKPEAIKIPGYTSYDPTDIWSKGNVWANKKPSISVKKSKNIEYGASFSVMKGVKAKNTTGYDCTRLVKVKIYCGGKKVKKVNTKKPGTYKVVYSVKDQIKRTAKVTKRFKVKAAKTTPVISETSNIYVTKKSKLTKKMALKHCRITQNGKKMASKHVKVTYKKTKQNVYKVTITAQNASKQAKKTLMAYVDNVKPVISGFADKSTKQVPVGSVVDKNFAWQQIKVSDNVSSLKNTDTVVTITKDASGKRYTIVYTLKDQAGNKATKTLYVQMVPYFTMSGGKDLEVNADLLGLPSDASQEEITEAVRKFALEGVTAKTYTGVDVTKRIVADVTVSSVTEDTIVYKIVYQVSNSAGYRLTQTYYATYKSGDTQK